MSKGQVSSAGEASADRGFRRAALRLAASERNDDHWWDAAVDAAAALMALAGAGSMSELRAFLSPDLDASGVRWTVSCYQSGEVNPSDERDFDDPIPALAFYAACGDKSHISSEMVAIAPNGVRWTALTRLRGQLSFHLPDSQTTVPDDGADPAVGDALRHWDEQLAEWAHELYEQPILSRAPRGLTLGQRIEARLAMVETQQLELLEWIASLDARIQRLCDSLEPLDAPLDAQPSTFDAAAPPPSRSRWGRSGG